MQKFLILIGVTVCFGVLTVKAQSCCGNPTMTGASENILDFTSLSKKRIILDLNADYTHFKPTYHFDSHSDSSHDHHHNHTTNANMQPHTSLQSIFVGTVQIRYGLHSKVTLHTQVPLWLIHTSDKHTSTLGDIPLLASCKIVQHQNYGANMLMGVELPTGNNYIVFENNYLVTGSGSFDPIMGASFWFKYKKILTRLQTQYRQGMKGFDNIHFGSHLNTQWIIAYYIKGLETDSKFKINLNTGIHQDWTNAHSLNRKFLDNTGSFFLWYSVGTQIQYNKWLFPLSFTFPTYMHLRGMQNKPQMRIKIGLTLLF
jgi:hypothetical protein